MQRFAVLIPMLVACSRTPMGLHSPDGGASGTGGSVAMTASGGSGGGIPATGGAVGTGGTTAPTSGSGGSTSTTDLETCSSDADCLSSCIWVTAPTNSSQCSAFYCCGMTRLSKRRCEQNQAAWASFCPGQSPVSQPCPCIEMCPDEVYGCFGGRCTTACKPTNDAAPNVSPVCGDGIVTAPEECDLGEQNNTAVYGDRSGCTRACTRPHYCGDGYTDADEGEMCDYGEKNGPPPCGSQCIYWI
jgi:hypothetical protein